MFSKFLDPTLDIAFKKIFGEERHKQLPIDFLNATLCLKGKARIVDLQFLNPHQPPAIEARKESIVDVLVQDEKGTKYIVEMQVAHFQGFEERAQFYAAKTYCSHFKRGDKYHDLKKVIFLAITDYVAFPEKKHYKSDHAILDKKTYEHDLKGFSFTFIELPKFNKSLDQIKTMEDRWCYFLKHADESNEIPRELAQSKEIAEAYEVIERFNWNEAELEYYDKGVMNIADRQAILDGAWDKGYEQGLKKGLEKRLEKRLEKGRKEGEKQGKALMALKLLKQGLDADVVTQAAGLSSEELKELQREFSPK